MWNEVVGLLGIRFGSEEEYNQFRKELIDFNDWFRREYPNLTCEEVRRAYNMAVKRELPLKDVFPVLAPKYAGEVIDAYRRMVDSDVEVNRVFAGQLLTHQPAADPTPDQIEEIMNHHLQSAINTVRDGDTFPDPGNALYQWLFDSGRIKPTPAEQLRYMRQAEPQVRQLLASEKESLGGGTIGDVARAKQLGGLIAQAMNGNYLPDYITRVQAQAKYLFLNDYLKTLSDSDQLS